MLKSNYVSRTFWDKELHKVEQDLAIGFHKPKKEKGFEIEIISSNIFLAPMPSSAGNNAFFIYVLFTQDQRADYYLNG